MVKPKFIFTWHFDAGRAWLKVPRALLAALEVESQISTYSYSDGYNVYLEEDCDAPAFLTRARNAELWYETRERNDGDNSRVRSLPHYEAPQGVSV